MDFHSLSRKELQTLCKKNLIPANMTNIAMADALAALTNVEGIEDIARTTVETVSECPQSLPDSPGTCRRTSTRRRPIESSTENEPKSNVPLTRSRLRVTRLSNPDEGQEKKDHKDLNENPSGLEIPKTPATRTGRKRATGVTSDLKKNETHFKESKENGRDGRMEENQSIVRVYGTRRSARLMSDNKISESVPKKGRRRTQAIKIIALSEEESEDLEKKSVSFVKDEIEEEEGAIAYAKACDTNPNADQEDLMSEDASATVVSAKVSGSIKSIVPEHSTPEDLTFKDANVTQVSVEVSGNMAVLAEHLTTEKNSNPESEESVVADSNADHVLEYASTTLDSVAEDSNVNQETLILKDDVVNVVSVEVSGSITVLPEHLTTEKNLNSEGEESVIENSNADPEDQVSERASTTHVLESSPLKKMDNGDSIVRDSNGECVMNLLPSPSGNRQLERKTFNVDVACTDYDLTVKDEFCGKVSDEIQHEVSSHSEIWDFAHMKGSIQEFLSSVRTENCNSDVALLDIEVISEIKSGDKKSEEDPLEAENIVTNQSKNQIDAEISDQVVDDDAESKANSPINIIIESEESHKYPYPCLSEDPKPEAEKFSLNAVVDADMKCSIQEFLSSVKAENCNPDAALLDIEVMCEIETGDKKSEDDPLGDKNSVTEKSKNQMDCEICDHVVDHKAEPKADSLSDIIESKESCKDQYPCLSGDPKMETEKLSLNAIVDADNCGTEVSKGSESVMWVETEVSNDTHENLSFEVSKGSESVMWVETEVSNDSDSNNSVSRNAIQTRCPPCSCDLDLGSKIPFISSASDHILPSQVPACLSPNRVTASESNNMKVTTPKMIKVLHDNKENNNSGTMSLRNNLKPIMTFAEEKENNNINKGEDSRQKVLKNMSLRQLRKMFKENLKIVDNTDNNDNTISKEQQKLENSSRSALQTLSDNCLLGEGGN